MTRAKTRRYIAVRTERGAAVQPLAEDDVLACRQIADLARVSPDATWQVLVDVTWGEAMRLVAEL